MSTNEFDYIVVGGGAGGCVVASRLSEDSNKKVLLLEQGPDDNKLAIKVNGTYFRIMGTERTVNYFAESQESTNGRPIQIMQANMLGGGHSMNAMLYVRGQREDYDNWAANGCNGWSYDEVLPYFKKSENNLTFKDKWHGTQGLMPVSNNVYEHTLGAPFIQSTITVGKQLGLNIKENLDFNGEQQAGVGRYQITSSNGERRSSARAFLKPALIRPNLTVRVGVSVRRVAIEDKRATGVVVMNEHGQEESIRCKGEVVVTAGSVISPKILMLSGIGDAAHLKEMGIDVQSDLPGVGENYQDHLVAPVDGLLNQPISLLGQDKGLKAVRHALKWLFFRKGLLSSNLVETGGFFDLDGDGRPEIQIHTLAMASTSWGQLADVKPEHGFSVAPCCLTSYSRGVIRLKDSNPETPPHIQANYLEDERDVHNLVRGVRFARKILTVPPLSNFIEREIMPGADVKDDDESLEKYVRDNVQMAFHPVGTCAMGNSAKSVVNTELQVHGIQGLRVADASVMPTLIRGNTTAPTIMIAERAAEFIKAAARQ